MKTFFFEDEMIFTPEEDTLKNEEEEAEDFVSLFFSLFFSLSPFFLRLFCPSLHNTTTTTKKKKKKKN